MNRIEQRASLRNALVYKKFSEVGKNVQIRKCSNRLNKKGQEERMGKGREE